MPDPLSYSEEIIHSSVDEDLRHDIWFDGDNEGPFTLAQIEAQIADRPEIAHQFHVVSEPKLTYPSLLPHRHAALTRLRA